MTQINLTEEGLEQATRVAQNPSTLEAIILLQLNHLTSIDGRGQTSVNLEDLVKTGNLSHITGFTPIPIIMRKSLRGLFEQGLISILEPTDTLEIVSNTYIKA